MSSISKEIVVQAARERAVRVFTENFDSWWPRGHHIGKADMKAAIMEPRTNGRWYELGVDGSECDWGTSSPGAGRTATRRSTWRRRRRG